MLETKRINAGDIQCHVLDECLAHSNSKLSCWEIAEKNYDFRFEYNICDDCIVYKYSSQNDDPAQQQFKDILHDRLQYNIEH